MAIRFKDKMKEWYLPAPVRRLVRQTSARFATNTIYKGWTGRGHRSRYGQEYLPGNNQIGCHTGGKWMKIAEVHEGQ
jgi:hypothetical protein